MTVGPSPGTRARTLGVLAMLYFVQGLPFGFQNKGLKLAMTGLGLSMTAVTLASALSLPWSLKPLIAPFVDRHGWPAFGRRKSWIVPLQAGLAVACFVAGVCPPETQLAGLMVAVLFMNVFAAAQDVPVDGLAVDVLGETDLGVGNAVQVVGYKVGMLVGGSVLVSQLPRLGWNGMFGVMGGLCVLAMLATVLVREPVTAKGQGSGAERLSWKELVGRVRKLFDSAGARWLLGFVATYKLGETLADQLFEPWLVRVARYEVHQAAGFAGWGMVGSLLGSALGAVIATRFRLLTAVGIAASVRCVPLVAMWAMVGGVIAPSPGAIIALTSVEHFFAGMLTTPMFAYMMSRVDKRIGATHFTLLAAVEVVGKSIPGLAAGALADAVGFPLVFVMAVGLSIGFLGLVPAVRRTEPHPG